MDKMKTNGAMLEQIDLTLVPRSAFDVSNHNYLTGKLGAIIPTRVKEVSPGDKLEGSVHIVTNFEPMAAPIMANMVQKEESFFIPYEVIWDKAHRFFTGKKGFNASMPSVTLKRLYNVLSNSHLIINDEQFLDIVVVNRLNPSDNTSAINDIELRLDALTSVHDVIKTAVQGTGVEYYILDIVTPLIERMQENYEHILSLQTEESYSITDPQAKDDEILNAYIKYFADIFNFWFGPSSMLDYMGVLMYDFTDLFRGIFSVVKYNNPDEGFTFYSPSNYFGEIPINWMPLRAAYWCWYWNYRDQLIELDALDPEEEMRSSTISVDEIINCLVVRQRCWFKDTFTTALTNTGDGNLIVPTALGVLENTTSLKVTEVVQNISHTDDKKATINAGANLTRIKVGDITYDVPSRYLSLPTSAGGQPIESSTTYGLSLDLFDRFKRLSSWISKRLILGTEYDDVIYSSFMVKLSNVEMRVPEILSAGRTQVAINVVVNNTTTAEQIAGDKTAVAYADNADDMDSQNYFAEQHGLCLHFMTIMPIPSYPQGIQRHYLRQNRFDYYWPEFSQLGFDAIYTAELIGLLPVGSKTPVSDRSLLAVFGYQGRYFDYKMSQDEQHGRLLTDLSYLTFGRKFGAPGQTDDLYEEPLLNYIFVHCWPSLEPFVMDDRFEDVFRSDVHFRSGWERPIPVPSKVLR